LRAKRITIAQDRGSALGFSEGRLLSDARIPQSGLGIVGAGIRHADASALD